MAWLFYAKFYISVFKIFCLHSEKTGNKFQENRNSLVDLSSRSSGWLDPFLHHVVKKFGMRAKVS